MKQWISNIVVYLASWMLDDPIKAAKRAGYIAFALVVLFAVSAWAQPVHAATATLECEAPTQYEDGSDILAPITYTAHYGVNPQELAQAANLGSVCGGVITVPDPAPGESITWYFGVRAHVNGVQSALSNVASKTFTTDLPVPNPPANLRTVETTAYDVRFSVSRFAFVRDGAVGTVELGTACDRSFRVSGDYYRVPREAIALQREPSSAVQVAKCGA